MKKTIITFDGTSASGKGTIAKIIAKKFDFVALDTGKLYRMAGLVIIRLGYNDNYLDKLVEIKKKINIDDFLEKELYRKEISEKASQIAQKQEIRDMLYSFQQDFINNNDKVILEGRDTGSVICPNADIKFYVDADSNIRAKRRFLQNEKYNIENNITIEDIEGSLKQRDYNDKNREISPLIVPKNAHIIDNSSSDLENTIKNILLMIEKNGQI